MFLHVVDWEKSHKPSFRREKKLTDSNHKHKARLKKRDANKAQLNWEPKHFTGHWAAHPCRMLSSSVSLEAHHRINAAHPIGHRRLHRRSPTPPLWPPAEAEVGTSAPTRSGASRRPWISSTTSPSPRPTPRAAPSPYPPRLRLRLQGFTLPFTRPSLWLWLWRGFDLIFWSGPSASGGRWGRQRRRQRGGSGWCAGRGSRRRWRPCQRSRRHRRAAPGTAPTSCAGSGHSRPWPGSPSPRYIELLTHL